MLLDIDYILLGMPGVAVALWACWRNVSARREGRGHTAASGLSGAETARRLLETEGADAAIAIASGPLATYYDRPRRVLRLEQSVHSGQSLAAVGLAAHEAGHALQHAARFPAILLLRDAIVPLANLGSILSWLLILAGLILGIFRFTVWGLAVFSVTVLLQLLNLPIEIDATRRAQRALHAADLIANEDETTLFHVMNAAAWKHVAETLTGMLSLVVDLLPIRLRDQTMARADRP